MTAKAQILEAVKKLPDDLSYDEIIRRVEVLAGLQEAQDEIARGEGIPLEDIIKDMPSWVTKS